MNFHCLLGSTQSLRGEKEAQAGRKVPNAVARGNAWKVGGKKETLKSTVCIGKYYFDSTSKTHNTNYLTRRDKKD